MKARIGTKEYDTDKAVLVETREDGVQVYRKKTRQSFFLYNPAGKNKHERFTDLDLDEAQKYMPVPNDESKSVTTTSKTIRFSDYNIARIKRLAGPLPMAQFILMLVDEYERNHDEG